MASGSGRSAAHVTGLIAVDPGATGPARTGDLPISRGEAGTGPARLRLWVASVASRDLAARFVLIVLFWILYALLGSTLASTHAFGRLDVYVHIYDMDIYQFIEGVSDVHSVFPRTETHPLFPLFFRPVGTLLARASGSPFSAALILTSLVGGVCVGLAHLFLRLTGLSPLSALLWSAILGLSFSHLVFGSVPETFIFSAASVITLFILLRTSPGSLGRFVPAGVVASGILVTNVVQSAIPFVVSLGRAAPLRRRLGASACFVVLVVAGLLLLGWGQQRVYPETSHRFLHIHGEVKWLFVPRGWGEGLGRLDVLVRHVFAYSVVAPKPKIAGPERLSLGRMPNLTMRTRIVKFHPVGVLAIGLWTGLMGVAAVGLARSRSYRVPEVVALASSMLFNLGLHYLYGTEFFLYSADWMFLLVSLVALGVTRGFAPSAWTARACTVAALLLVICEGLNNGLVLGDLVREFRWWMR